MFAEAGGADRPGDLWAGWCGLHGGTRVPRQRFTRRTHHLTAPPSFRPVGPRHRVVYFAHCARGRNRGTICLRIRWRTERVVDSPVGCFYSAFNFHTRAELSALAEISDRPSAANATPLTGPRWPFSTPVF